MNFRNSSCTLFAATALALAGCGESDSTTTYTNPVPDLLVTMGEQSRKASGAKGSTDMSLKDATTKATMLSAVKVMGESSVAEANAQAVLDAKAKVDKALMDANAALTALQEAKTKADALPADTPKLEELKTELATAITEATRHRDAIKAIKDATGNDSLAKLVEKVTGANGKGTPAEIAAAVAQEVEKAMAIVIGTGSNFAPITGGEKPTVITAWNLSTDDQNSYGIPSLDTAYPSWVIHNLPGARVEQTDYASYGYWLGIPPEGGTILATYVFGPPKDEKEILIAILDANESLGNTATYSGKALGMSVLTTPDGSNHKAIRSGEFTADVTLTATFKGADSTVKGMIDNFKGTAVGSDWSVELKNAPLLRAGQSSFSDHYGLSRGSGAKHNAAWNARASHGTTSSRPKSISGSFQSFFGNGRATGGYATVKDE